MIVETLLEVIKYSVPAMVIYLLMRQFYRQQYSLEAVRQKAALTDHNRVLRLQAYERMAVLVERLDIPALVLRLNQDTMKAGNLQAAMLIAVQQEYEHNLSQQIYISTQLWQMVQLLKEETQAGITTAHAGIEMDNKAQYIDRLYVVAAQSIGAMNKKVLSAIRQEVQLYFS